MPKERKHFLRRLIEFRFLFLINLVIILFISVSLGREFLRNYEIKNDIQQLQARADSLSAQHIRLTELNQAIQTEFFLEREARLKLGMKKPNENVLVVRQPEARVEGVQNGQDGGEVAIDPLHILEEFEQPEVANPTRWWYYLFDQSEFNNLP